MGGTKIFVLRIKDVIKMAVFAVIGLIVVGVLVFLFIPGASRQDNNRELPSIEPRGSLYTPGTYVASIILNDRPVDILVTVTENEIVAVEMTEMYESQRMLFPLFEPMMERVSDDVLFYQRADVVIHNDFPITTGILQQAVAAALQQALLEIY